MSFQIGDRVVCVDASKQAHTVEELNQDVPNWIQKGQKYVIRGFSDYDFVVAVYLEEIRNPLKYFKVINRMAEPGFRTDRFRKLEPAEVAQEVEELQEAA